VSARFLGQHSWKPVFPNRRVSTFSVVIAASRERRHRYPRGRAVLPFPCPRSYPTVHSTTDWEACPSDAWQASLFLDRICYAYQVADCRPCQEGGGLFLVATTDAQSASADPLWRPVSPLHGNTEAASRSTHAVLHQPKRGDGWPVRAARPSGRTRMLPCNRGRRGGKDQPNRLAHAQVRILFFSRRSSRRHARERHGISVTIISAARSSIIQTDSCASVPSGWRMIRATSSPCRMRPVAMTASPQRG
jgi:hypothetical protein